MALSDIPEILYEARFYLDAYRVPRLSINMLEKMADLCNHVLIVLREIVYYCLESKSSKYTYLLCLQSGKVASLIFFFFSIFA